MPTPSCSHRTLTISFLAAMAACSSGQGDITDPESPLPPPVYLYTATITVDSIKISSLEACDGKDIFGKPLPGAFHYRVAVRSKSGEDAVASSGYGSVLGTAIPRGPKGIIGLGYQKLIVPGLEADDDIDLKFAMIEWDGPFMDGRLKGQVAVTTETPGARGVHFRNPDDLATGDMSTCGGTLYYQLEVIGKPK